MNDETDQEIVIYGPGGFGREVLQIVLDQKDAGHHWRFMGWLSDDASSHGSETAGHPIHGDMLWLRDRSTTNVSVAIGNGRARRTIVESIVDKIGHQPMPALVHPTAWMGRNVAIGDGTIVCSGTRITTDVEIGQHVLINLNCTIGHDCIIGDFATLFPGANVSGDCRLGENVEIGTNATILPGITIGAGARIGAGAVVTHDVPPGVTAVGVPARPVGTPTVPV